MPNKSDSAGKIHEYFTYLELKSFYNIKGYSPFDSDKSWLMEEFKSLFTSDEINGLYNASILTFRKIKEYLEINYPSILPNYINHSGEISGVNCYDNTDDLVIKLENNIEIPFSLKCSKSKGTILSKNMGASSLIENYFGSKEGQIEFNEYFKKEHLVFLNSVFGTDFSSIRDAKKYISDKSKEDGYTKDRFEYYNQAENARNIFLPKLPLKLLNIINCLDINNLIKAVNIILDAGANIIFATYGDNISADFYNIPKQQKEDYICTEIRDNRSIVIKFRNFYIGFRYKFESSITSSIKLVGDYKDI